MKVTVVGLGKLGAPLAAVYAAAGHRVIGVDTNPANVAKVNAGSAPVQETGLQELMSSLPTGRLQATVDLTAAVQSSDITCIIVPTPSQEDGRFSNEFIYAAIDTIGAALYESDREDHVVVVCSTVMPGATDGPIRARLEEASGLHVGINLGLCYSPEFIALGSVIKDMHQPDVVLIGESDYFAGSRYEELVKTVVPPLTPIKHMSIVNAELAKIAINTYVTMKISYANTLSSICDTLPGASAYVVADAVGFDSRVGGKYLQPGTAYGGPCFPRDTRAFHTLVPDAPDVPSLAQTAEQVNDQQNLRFAEKLHQVTGGKGTIGILGLSYKPGTKVVEESAGIKIVQHLLEWGHRVIAYDPVAHDAAWDVLADAVTYASSKEEVYKEASVVLIATPWSDFSWVPKVFSGAIIDPWRVVQTVHDNVRVHWVPGVRPV